MISLKTSLGMEILAYTTERKLTMSGNTHKNCRMVMARKQKQETNTIQSHQPFSFEDNKQMVCTHLAIHYRVTRGSVIEGSMEET